MANNFKIHQGTGRLTGESLCRSCSYGHIFTDARGEHVDCSRMFNIPRSISGKVFECNDYSNRSLPSISAMEEIAWTVSTDKAGKAVGFMPPEKKDK